MTARNDYERIGIFVFSAYRYGADLSDVHNWMADDLRVARPDAGDEHALRALYTAFFARYVSDHELQANYERFVDSIKGHQT